MKYAYALAAMAALTTPALRLIRYRACLRIAGP